MIEADNRGIKMIFSADLDKVRLTEVMWFLLRFEKDGLLTCEAGEETVHFYLRDGVLERIVNPYDDLRLGEILMRKGFIDRKWLDRALKQQRELKKQLGEVMLQLNILKREHLGKMLRNQFEEIVMRVCELEGARVEFKGYPADEYVFGSIFTNKDDAFLKIVTNLDKKVSEFFNLGEKLPSDDSIINVPKRDKLNPKILQKEEIRQIIDLADGTRSLRQIRRKCTSDLLKTQEMLLKLYEAKVLQVVETEKEASSEE